MRVLILANGDAPDPELAHQYADWADLVLAADGGGRHALSLDLQPDLVIGDMDSSSPAERERLEAGGARFIVHPPAKDETDLELALRHAVEREADEIVVLAALGGRLDQTIANVLLLSLPELIGRDVRLVAGPQPEEYARLTACLVRDRATIQGRPGDLVSLIPLGGEARGVTTEGLKYPLSDDPLPFGPALGVSNELNAPQARIKVRDGLLLCIHFYAEEG